MLHMKMPKTVSLSLYCYGVIRAKVDIWDSCILSQFILLDFRALRSNCLFLRSNLVDQQVYTRVNACMWSFQGQLYASELFYRAPL